MYSLGSLRDTRHAVRSAVRVYDVRMKNTHSPLTVTVTAEGAFKQTVQSHGAHVLKHVQAVLSLSQQVAPFSLK